jgi:hypothetical protein
LVPGLGARGGALLGLLGGGGGNPVGFPVRGWVGEVGLVEPMYLTCAGVGACLFFPVPDPAECDEPWTEVALVESGCFVWVAGLSDVGESLGNGNRNANYIILELWNKHVNKNDKIYDKIILHTYHFH